MSAKCQWRACRPPQWTSIDHLIGELLKKQGNIDAQRLRRFQINEKFKFRRLLDVQVGRFGSLKDFVHVGCAAPIEVGNTRPIPDEPSELHKLARIEHAG